MLIDAGPLVSLTDRSEPTHSICKEFLARSRFPLTTTWAAVTEAMYLVHRRGGWPAQNHLWRLVQDSAITITHIPGSQHEAIAQLMKRYRDAPMDLADATLVVAAELLNDREIFTLDDHFQTYRLSRNRRFKVLPA
jgi:predicted nucleic acid-binding protein